MPLTFVKRTVSPIQFESAPTLPEDVLCAGSEEEDSTDERRQKRRRIETLGTEYLEGKGLFIQSASLRGPFEKDWENPWAKPSSRYGGEGIRRFPEARQPELEKRSASRELRREPVTAKRRSTASIREVVTRLSPGRRVFPRPSSTDLQEPVAKRRKHMDALEEDAYATSGRPPLDRHENWLKGKLDGDYTRYEDTRKAATPTPAARDPARLITKSPEQKGRRSMAESSPQAEWDHGFEQAAGILPYQGFTPINGRSVAAHHQPPPQQREQTEDQLNATLIKYREEREQSDEYRRSRDQVEPEQSYSEKVSSGTNAPREPPKTLAPYVSALVEQVSSSKLAAKHPNRSPRRSPHAVPASAYLPEFNYHYSRNGSVSTSDKSNAPFVDAPEEIVKRERSRSSSSASSSGSSAFAEALNAAQAKANSAARTSSLSSTPRIEAEIKRLSFTASGKPKVRTSRPSSRSGPDYIDPALLNGGDGGLIKSTSFSKQSSKTSDKTTSLSKQSSKFSDKPMTNGDPSREVLPDAQIVPNAPVPLVPSGPSTNLLETERQSPKHPSMDQGDSYMNLSTQAAILKAQQSFQNDVLGTLNDSIEKAKLKNAQPSVMQAGAANITPITNDRRRQMSAGNLQPVKAEEYAEEDAMSTQAIINETSPFAITTTKKRPPPTSLRKRASFAPSPIRIRKPQPDPSSLPSPTSPGTPPTARTYHDRSMSTSSSDPPPSPPSQHSAGHLSRQHSAAKPPSSGLTSFSILPNGTFTETQMGPDGQLLRQVPPPPTFPEQDWGDVSLPLNPFDSMPNGNAVVDGAQGGRGLRDSWRDKENDLEVAIQEAGSFLGEWDVEAEARKEGAGRARAGK